MGEHGEGQRLEVLGVEVPLFTPHRLEQVLTGDNLKHEVHSCKTVICFTIVFTSYLLFFPVGVYLRQKEMKSH